MDGQVRTVLRVCFESKSVFSLCFVLDWVTYGLVGWRVWIFYEIQSAVFSCSLAVFSLMPLCPDTIHDAKPASPKPAFPIRSWRRHKAQLIWRLDGPSRPQRRQVLLLRGGGRGLPPRGVTACHGPGPRSTPSALRKATTRREIREKTGAAAMRLSSFPSPSHRLNPRVRPRASSFHSTSHSLPYRA